MALPWQSRPPSNTLGNMMIAGVRRKSSSCKPSCKMFRSDTHQQRLLVDKPVFG